MYLCCGSLYANTEMRGQFLHVLIQKRGRRAESRSERVWRTYSSPENISKRVGSWRTLAAYLVGELGEQIGENPGNMFDCNKNSQREKK